MTKLTHSIKRSPLAAIVVIMHLVGIAGFVSPMGATFALLTPLHLLIVAALLIYEQTDKSRGFWLFVFLAVISSFAIEFIGVSTGIIFGSYYYGTVLGPKVSGTPLIIGFNWLILLGSVGTVVDKYKIPNIGKATAGALVMTGLDYFIEPVAMAYGFWNWDEGRVPVQNYIAWFVVSFALLLVFYSLGFRKKNSLAPVVILSQAVFFIVINIALRLNG